MGNEEDFVDRLHFDNNTYSKNYNGNPIHYLNRVAQNDLRLGSGVDIVFFYNPGTT